MISYQSIDGRMQYVFTADLSNGWDGDGEQLLRRLTEGKKAAETLQAIIDASADNVLLHPVLRARALGQ